jgi:agmatine/peptidylarginine deiminase
MIMGMAMGAEPEPPEKEVPTEVSSLSELDGQVHETGTGNKGVPGLIKSKGAFAKLWNQQSFVGPGVLAFPRSHQVSKLCLPGDFEKHKAIVLASGWLAQEAPNVLSDIVIQTKPRMLLVFLVSSSRERDLTSRVLAERGLSPEAVRFLAVPMDTGWVRDFGPIFVCEAAGISHAVDAAYGKPGRVRDDAAAHAIADLFHVATTVTPLRWQGGNILSNGQGLLVTTTQSINANIECGYDLDTVACFLRRRFGVEQIVVLEHLVGERTGHIDMYACFTSPDTILVGEYDKSVDPQNAVVLDRNAARLAEVHTRRGKLKVIRVPMPTNQDGIWRSFTNVVFANGTLLVPTYPDVDLSGGEHALAIYRQLMPGWKVFGVDISTMARHHGGLRCVTLYVPEAGKRGRNSTATGPYPDADR